MERVGGSSTFSLDQRRRGKGRTRCEIGLSKLRIIIPDVSMTRVTPINSISGSGNRKSRLSYHPLGVSKIRGEYGIA